MMAVQKTYKLGETYQYLSSEKQEIKAIWLSLDMTIS